MSALVLNLNALLLILNLGWGLAAASMPIIPAPWGKISGTNVTSPGGQVYYSYLAIPYALPPVGQRRFARPVPHPGPAVGVVFEATSPGSVCPQLTPTMEMLVKEDCLTLDVHVPVGANGSNSVMVFIHGGNFVIGASPLYTPSELVTENDVIVVVIQYRLGILGFLSSGDDAASGNYGLLDQNLAIRWVRGNIRAFGGDEGSITLYGQAAGAASVGYHLLSPYSWGLFSRVILQSGTPLGSWALNKNPRETFTLVAKISGCEVAASSIGFAYYYRRVARRQQAEHERIVACLREMDFHQLLKFTSLPAHSLRSSDILPWISTVIVHLDC
ncbi:neuroligin-4, Y-linked-like [Littorina saxatilis]|uniref:neuroligin-4, Y-linked-like n=1 Tax=Littorina saxatilis TaxID=31220 RepID=UPI0038B42B1D